MLRCPSLEGYGPTDGVSMSGNVQGSMNKNSGAPPWRNTGQRTEFPCPEMCMDPLIKNSDAPPWRDMGQQTKFPCPEMCRGLWIKTPVPLPGGIWANGQSFHVHKCAGVRG